MPDSTASYTLERSPDGVNWQLLKVFDSTGTFYDDVFPLNPTNYYRLTETSVNGLTIPHDIAVVTVIPPMGNPPGTIAWATSTHGAVAGDTSSVGGVAADRNGNIIVVGLFKGSIDLGDGVFKTSTGGASVFDMFILKLNALGQFVWGKTFGSIGDDMAFGVATDASNNIIVVGQFANTIDFGGGNSVTAASGGDIFIAKFPPGSAGNPPNATWAKSFGTTGPAQNDWANCVAVDASNNIIVAGVANSGDINFGGGVLPPLIGQDVFVVKLNANGDYQWAIRHGGTGGDVCKAISVDGSGDVVIAGYTSGTNLDLGGGTIAGHGGTDFFVAKYNGLDGSHVWSKLIGSAGNEVAFGIAADRASNNVYVTGQFNLTVDFGGISQSASGGAGIYVVCYNAAGIIQWVNAYGGEPFASDTGIAAAVDSVGNVVVTGSAQSAIDFGGGFTFGDGAQNYFVLSLNRSGAYRWAKRVVGTNGGSICVDDVNSVIAAGTFGGTQNLGYPGNPVIVTTPSGSKAVFVAKYSN